MRISTSSLYATSTSQLGTLQSQLARTQQQLSTNHRMLSAADDPIASARVLEVTQSQSINAQYATNRANARASLSQEELALTGVQQLIQDVQETGVAAGNGTISASDRATYANRTRRPARRPGGAGQHVRRQRQLPVFRLQVGHHALHQTNTGVDYQGDQGQVQLQVGSARKWRSAIPAARCLPTSDRQRRLRHRRRRRQYRHRRHFGRHRQPTRASSPATATRSIFPPPGAPAVSSYTITDLTTNTTVPPAPAVATVPITAATRSLSAA